MLTEVTEGEILETGKAGSKIIEAKILGNTEIAGGIYRLTLQCGSEATDAKPGQFINVYLRDRSMLLPRPISICLAEGEQLTLVYRVVGKGTQALSEYIAGESLTVSTPLGRGYDVDAVLKTLHDTDEIVPEPKTVLLAAGGLGVPPMAELAKTIRRYSSFRLIASLGFQDAPFLIEELKTFCDEVYVATENGTAGFRGNVIEMMEARGLEADYYLSCGPKPMLKALAALCDRINKPLQVSLEERMGCGYGACVGCTCRTKEFHGGITEVKLKKVCKDGPVFFGDEVIWDE